MDDFLDRDKLVFNICSNTGNDFDRPTLERYFEVSRAVYAGAAGAAGCPAAATDGAANPAYWAELCAKFGAIHAEVQDASRSINKSFGIFNEETLRHCATNVAQDMEGYKSLIARPYESVNRAMPGSFYSDVERTIYLTFVVLMEDIGKYDELFQQERKFISFEVSVHALFVCLRACGFVRPCAHLSNSTATHQLTIYSSCPTFIYFCYLIIIILFFWGGGRAVLGRALAGGRL